MVNFKLYQKIKSYTSSYNSADEFNKNQRDFDATMMNFVIIGEMVSRLSEDFINKYINIDWFKIRGLRNIVAHDYFGIDAEEVWQIIQTHILHLERELTKIITENAK